MVLCGYLIFILLCFYVWFWFDSADQHNIIKHFSGSLNATPLLNSLLFEFLSVTTAKFSLLLFAKCKQCCLTILLPSPPVKWQHALKISQATGSALGMGYRGWDRWQDRKTVSSPESSQHSERPCCSSSSCRLRGSLVYSAHRESVL